MPIAETASTFCETIVTKAALKKANDQTKLSLLEDELSGATQVIVDIYSRYLFESRFFEKRETGALSVEEIKELMIQAQKDAYGDGLDHQYLHPYMWTWKPHYYYADCSFYNFPYAFGLLLAKGLYTIYQKEGSKFSNTYEKLLSLTGKMSLEDVCSSVNINLKDKSFWQASINTFKEDLTLYKQLLNKDVSITEQSKLLNSYQKLLSSYNTLCSTVGLGIKNRGQILKNQEKKIEEEQDPLLQILK